MEPPLELVLNPAQEAAMRAHAASEAPHECCGLLLGRREDDGRLVVEAVVPCTNASDAPRTRYLVAPAEVARVQRETRASGRQIVGFYHSHPDGPAGPSASDVAEACWPGFAWIILSGAPEFTTITRLLPSE